MTASNQTYTEPKVVPYVGRWCLGEKRWSVDLLRYASALEIHLRHRPTFLHRWFMNALLGIRWEDIDARA